MQDIIKNIRKRIDDVITGLIDKAKDWFKGKGKDKRKAKSEDDVTEEDRAKHKQYANEIEIDLKGMKPKEGESFADFRQRIQARANALEKQYQPKLTDGIKIDISLMNSAKEDEKDGDVDVKVKIAPNNYEEEFNVATEIYDGPPKGYAYFLRDFVQSEGQYIRHFRAVVHGGKEGGILIDLNGKGTKVTVTIKTRVNDIKVKAPKNGSAPPNMIILPVNKGVYSKSDFELIQNKYENKSYGANVKLDGGKITGGDFLTADCFAIALDVISGKLNANIPSIDQNYLYPGQAGTDQAKDNENARAFNSIIDYGTSSDEIKPKK